MKKSFIFFDGRMINAEHIAEIAHSEDFLEIYVYVNMVESVTAHIETFDTEGDGLERWAYLKNNLLAA